VTEDEIRSEFDRLADGYDLVVPRHIALALAKLVADVADRRAREECAAICNGFDACDPGYIADAICATIKPD
jgi:hypothetical protein